MKKSVKKPWGGFEQFVLNEKCTIKILKVGAGKRTSLQKHRFRSEFWRVLEPCRVWIGGRKIRAKVGDEFKIRVGQVHRLEGLKKKGSVLEISFGKFDEKDIIRLEDDYGRV